MRDESEIRERLERAERFEPVCNWGRGAKRAKLRTLRWVLEDDG